jgi:hypothetical protein
MPIKRGGQTRSNAGRYAPEGQGATQRGGRTRTPSGNARPTQTARLPRANMPGTVTPSGAARTAAAGAAGGGMLSRLALLIPHVAAAAAGLSAYNSASGELPASEQRKMQQTREKIAKEPKNLPRNPQEGMSRAESFDAAFAKARNAGEKTFSWRGRNYNTKMSGE